MNPEADSISRGEACPERSRRGAAPTVVEPILMDAERTRCEVWTRVMGYHRPVSAFNPGKQSEHKDRVFFLEFARLTVQD